MLLIGENIHIISKVVREALVNRDEKFVIDLIKRQSHLDYIDLNVGPSKKDLEGVLPWLCELVEKNSDLKISFDSTNASQIELGLKQCKNAQNAIINSTLWAAMSSLPSNRRFMWAAVSSWPLCGRTR